MDLFQENYAEALKKFEELLELKVKKFGGQSKEALWIQNEIALVCNVLSMNSLTWSKLIFTLRGLWSHEETAQKGRDVCIKGFSCDGNHLQQLWVFV